MKTVAVVLNWRRPDDTLKCVASLVAIDRDMDIVVLDNASGDGSFAMIAEGVAGIAARAKGETVVRTVAPQEANPWLAKGVRTILLVETGRNGGYAFGNNIGIALAMARPETAFVWILNNDTIVPSAASLDALIGRMLDDPAIGICGSTVAYSGQSDIVQTRAGGAFQRMLGRCSPIGIGETVGAFVDGAKVEAQLAYINGAAAFVSRKYIDTIGLMTERFFLYFEEIEWAWRGRSRFRLGYAPDSVVLHQVGAALGSNDFGAASPMSTYYLTRNRFKFLAANALLSLPGALTDVLRDAGRNILAGRKANVVATFRALLGLAYKPDA